MKRNIIAFADVENNRLNPLSQRDFKRALADFGQGTKLTVTLENYRRKRSLSQNNLLHKYFTIMAEECGQGMEEIKMIMKMKFGPVEAITDRDGEEMHDEEGEVITKLKSSADYSTKEMTDFIENVRDWSVQFLNCYLPEPEELRNNNLKQQ